MPKSPRRKRDIWFHGRWPFGFTPVSVEGLILSLVVLPVGLMLTLAADWLDKQGFDTWVGTASSLTGIGVLVIGFMLAVTHAGFDRDL